MEMSKLQQVGVDNRETLTTHSDQAPMFNEER